MPTNRAKALEVFGARQVKFVHYYKYSFTFAGEGVKVALGGDKDDIYRLSVDANTSYSISALMAEGPVYIWEGDNLVYDEHW